MDKIKRGMNVPFWYASYQGIFSREVEEDSKGVLRMGNVSWKRGMGGWDKDLVV